MAKKSRISTDNVIDCACVIHGTGYDWIYVDHLYNMLTRNLDKPIRFHVYTEADRSVPPHMIKHELTEWPGISGPKKSWWYKMQLFDPKHHTGDLLYFDLDCVIVNSLNWITELLTANFWTIRDFRYLQRQGYSGMNSSVMWWNVSQFAHIWNNFVKQDIHVTIKRYPGDQDYLGAVISPTELRYFENQHLQSWRWQAVDGGYDFARRQHKQPGTGPKIDPDTSILVFHGHPKPHEVQHSIIKELWQ